MRTLIVGCGYVGLALGKELARSGHEVFGMRRDRAAVSELEDAGIQPVIADITKQDDLLRTASAYDWVVNCVSSSRGGAEDYRSVYLGGMRNLVEWLTPRPQKFVYTSSTGVYGQVDGSTVSESDATEPAAETGQILVQTEKLLLEAVPEFPAVVLRVAGIYGPGRGYWFKQYLNGTAKIEGRGERLLNMIHRDDVVGAIIAALERGLPGEVYNAVDDEPVTQRAFFEWLAKATGGAMPPSMAEESNAERKRAQTHKKVSNQKLRRELGYRFRYPSFREGYRMNL